MRKVSWSLLAVLAMACGPQPGTKTDEGNTDNNQEQPDAGPPREAPELGTGDHTAGSVTLTEIATAEDGLRTPRDLEFNPSGTNELWIVNRVDDSTVTIYEPGTANERVEKRIDGFAMHFMEEVSSIAFGPNNTFGTCQETNNTYNGQAPGNNFMGPSLWTADMDIYAVANPEGLGSHLDMLHESPWCMGMAHVQNNIYWVFDGSDGSLVYYDFQQDHGPGYDDHSDGIIFRYVTGQVRRIEDIPSHMQFNHSDNHLYVADTGNSRIVKLDVLSGSQGRRLAVKEPGTIHREYTDAVLTDVVPEMMGYLQRPSGLVLHNGYIYVTDNANGRISAFKLDGTRVNYLETGLAAGALMGLTVGPDGKIYFVDALGDRVLRIDP